MKYPKNAVRFLYAICRLCFPTRKMLPPAQNMFPEHGLGRPDNGPRLDNNLLVYMYGVTFFRKQKPNFQNPNGVVQGIAR